ncbi:hypothetical protein [Agrobacterium sp. lyk4-40-TYG-31]|nr:hypothetical protein [Agrobacterium sp. lyk4-40-TYG-31]
MGEILRWCLYRDINAEKPVSNPAILADSAQKNARWMRAFSF